MFATVIALKLHFVGKSVIVRTFLKLTDSILFEQHDKSLLFKSTHYIALYPQNGDRIVAIDSMTLLHPCIQIHALTHSLTDRQTAERLTCVDICRNYAMRALSRAFQFVMRIDSNRFVL